MPLSSRPPGTSATLVRLIDCAPVPMCAQKQNKRTLREYSKRKRELSLLELKTTRRNNLRGIYIARQLEGPDGPAAAVQSAMRGKRGTGEAALCACVFGPV